jgi:hypothetical protein
MEEIFAEDIEVGMTVVNPSGDKYKVVKIDADPDVPGRIRLHDKKCVRSCAGKKAKFYLVF